MKRVLLILFVGGLVSMACSLGSSSGINNPSESNNPQNLNTPDSSNPGQAINTPLPPTDFAPNPATPIGDSPGPGTPTVPSLNEAGTPPLFTPTQPPTPAATTAP